MKRTTFILTGALCLVVVMLGFIVLTFLNNNIVSFIFIATGGILFWWGLRIAKKEEWFGKPSK